MAQSNYRIATVLKSYETELAKNWVSEMKSTGSDLEGRIGEQELHQQAREFLNLIQHAAQSGDSANLDTSAWISVKEFLESVSRSRALQGFSSSETATFIFSFKKPLFAKLREVFGSDAQTLADEIWTATQIIDQLGLHTVKAFQQTREDTIRRQQEELLELSTPVVKLWDGILALPMIGTLDSSRTQIVMESLLQRIVETESEIAIIDITGVPTVDTLVAQHLLKTITAIRLMGADCIISGIRPQIAQTIVHLGVELQGVMTKSNLADALKLALRKRGQVIAESKAQV